MALCMCVNMLVVLIKLLYSKCDKLTLYDKICYYMWISNIGTQISMHTQFGYTFDRKLVVMSEDTW